MSFVVKELRGIDPHFLYFLDSGLVVVRINGVGKQEFGLALGSVDFDRYGHSGTDQYSIRTLFGHNQTPFFDTELTAEMGGNYDCTAFANFAGVH